MSCVPLGECLSLSELKLYSFQVRTYAGRSSLLLPLETETASQHGHTVIHPESKREKEKSLCQGFIYRLSG